MACKDSVWCLPSTVLLTVGGVNWGLVGLGMLLDTNLNVVNLILGGVPVVEAIVYLAVGVMGLKVLVFALMGKKCCC